MWSFVIGLFFISFSKIKYPLPTFVEFCLAFLCCFHSKHNTGTLLEENLTFYKEMRNNNYLRNDVEYLEVLLWRKKFSLWNLVTKENFFWKSLSSEIKNDLISCGGIVSFGKKFVFRKFILFQRTVFYLDTFKKCKDWAKWQKLLPRTCTTFGWETECKTAKLWHLHYRSKSSLVYVPTVTKESEGKLFLEEKIVKLFHVRHKPRHWLVLSN